MQSVTTFNLPVLTQVCCLNQSTLLLEHWIEFAKRQIAVDNNKNKIATEVELKLFSISLVF